MNFLMCSKGWSLSFAKQISVAVTLDIPAPNCGAGEDLELINEEMSPRSCITYVLIFLSY